MEVQTKWREVRTVFTFAVLVVRGRGVALVTRTHVGAFKVGAGPICADLRFQALIHILKNGAHWKGKL